MFDLATVITSRTRLDVLTLFIKNPELELGIRETARRLDANPMLVRHELNILSESGLLKSRRVANSIQFSLDSGCGAAEPLRALLDMNNGSSAHDSVGPSTQSPSAQRGSSTPKDQGAFGMSGMESKSRTTNKAAKAATPPVAETESEDNFDD